MDIAAGGSRAHKTSSPIEGVAFGADGDYAACKMNFTEDTHDITIKGFSSDNYRVELYIGGQFVQSFSLDDPVTMCTIKGLHHVTGDNQEVRLVSVGNERVCDVRLEYIRFENGRNEGVTDDNVDNEVLYDGKAVDNNCLERDDEFNNEQSDEHVTDGEK